MIGLRQKEFEKNIEIEQLGYKSLKNFKPSAFSCKLIQQRQKEYEKLSEFPCKLIQFGYKTSKILSSMNFHAN